MTIILSRAAVLALSAFGTYCSAQDPPVDLQLTVCSNHFGQYEIVTVTLDGRVSRITAQGLRGTDPAWSPDGERMALQRQGQLVVTQADGTAARQLTEFPGVKRFFSWSPDGKRIVFEVQEKGVGDIFAVDADGRNLKQLTDRPGADLWPAWSPDGSWIAFGSTRAGGLKLCVMNPDGAEDRVICAAPHYWTCPSWSPDGRLIAFGMQSDLYITDLTGRSFRQVTHAQAEEANIYPAWSPDGRYIAYVRYRGVPESPTDTSNVPGDLILFDVLRERHTQLLEGSLPRYGARPSWRPVQGNAESQAPRDDR